MRPLLVALLVAGVGFAASVTFFIVSLSQPLKLLPAEILLVQRGDSISSLVDSLHDQSPVSAFLFRGYARLTANRGHIKAGEYRLDAGLTFPDLLAKLRSGDVIQRQITFPEGWTTEQWIAQLTQIPLLTNNSAVEIQAAIGDVSEWEGRLYPDTYSFTRGESASAVLSRARNKMNRVLDDVWLSRSSDAEVTTKDEALILASLIEKETGYEPDRAIIASVFNNRLAQGMKLQSDPTVIYGLKDFDGDLRRRHLSQSHPYNTYVVRGLPAGPICNPGRASLEAALNPPATPYLYFVAQGDGRSYFSTNLDEHNRAVTRYQKTGRVKDYRSAPPVAPP